MQAAAAVTAQLLDDELAGQGLRALAEDPVVQDRRVIVVRGSGSDVGTMVTALDEILRDGPTARALDPAADEPGGPGAWPWVVGAVVLAGAGATGAAIARRRRAGVR